MSRPPVVLALVVAIAAPLSAQQPERFVLRAATLDVSVNFDSSNLRGRYTMELENWTDRPASHVSLALNRLLEASRVTDASGAPLRFAQDVMRFRDDPMRQVTQIDVTLPRMIAPGARTTIRVDYSGYIAPYTEIGWLYVKDHIDTAFTILRSDALAFPEIQGLNDAANRKRPHRDFLYEASVRVPASYVVATGGPGTRTTNGDGTATWTYRSVKPSPFLNIAIAHFDTLTTSGVRIFYFPADSAGARYIARNSERALRLFASSFGALRDNPTVTLIEIPDGWGSQANLVGGIIQTASAFRDTAQINEVYHELAHLWNTVGDGDQPSPRWNEGLSTFLEALTKEKLNGWPNRPKYDAWYLARVKDRAQRDSMVRITPFVDYGKRGMTNNSYSVGFVMFSTLYSLVGESAFDKALADLYAQYPNGATTRDLVQVVNRATPVNVDRFFDDFLFTTKWTDVVASVESMSDIAKRYRP